MSLKKNKQNLKNVRIVEGEKWNVLLKKKTFKR